MIGNVSPNTRIIFGIYEHVRDVDWPSSVTEAEF